MDSEGVVSRGGVLGSWVAMLPNKSEGRYSDFTAVNADSSEEKVPSIWDTSRCYIPHPNSFIRLLLTGLQLSNSDTLLTHHSSASHQPSRFFPCSFTV